MGDPLLTETSDMRDIHKGAGLEKKNRINHLENSGDDLFVARVFSIGNKSLLQER